MAESNQKTGLIYHLVPVAISLAAFFLFGCRSEIRPVPNPVAVPDQFSGGGGRPLPEKWWQAFEDPALDALMEEALGGNFTIRIAWDRLTQAEQIAVQAGAALLPQADYQAGAERTRREIDSRRTYTTEYALGLGASYEIDLWGRVRSARQAAVLDARAAQDDLAAAAVTLSANVAKNWYQLLEAKSQESLISDQLETNRKVLDSITVRFRQAQAGAAEVFRQRQLVETTHGQLIQVRESIVLLQHQLSLLLGKPPALGWQQNADELIWPPPLPQTGVPSEALLRRPDIAASYKTVQAADRRVAAAIAEQYPRIGLSASALTYGPRTNDLFDDWLANLAANAAGPLLDGGYRKAEVRRRRAVLSQALNQYALALLNALREVEDALRRETSQRTLIDNLQGRLVLAQKVFETTRTSYLQGQLDYLRVLDALVSMQSLQRDELTARRVLIEHRIDLCRALAGGWQMQRPAQAQLTDKTEPPIQRGP